MKAIVISDTWKSNLSVGDEISDQDFAPDMIIRADQGGYVCIQDEDYRDQLKDDFPYLNILREAGYSKHSEIDKASDEDLLSIEGIGPARLKEIRGYVA